MKMCLHHNLYFGVKHDECAMFNEGDEGVTMVPTIVVEKEGWVSGMCSMCHKVIEEDRITHHVDKRREREGTENLKPLSTCLDLTQRYGHRSASRT